MASPPVHREGTNYYLLINGPRYPGLRRCRTMAGLPLHVSLDRVVFYTS